MAAVVAPVGVENSEFRLCGDASFPPEILHHLAKVIHIHGKAVRMAERRIFILRHSRKAGKVFQRFYIRLFRDAKLAEILASAFNGIDKVMSDLLYHGIRSVIFKYQQSGTFDGDICRRVDQMHTVHCGRCTLVKLPGNILDSEIFLAGQVQRVAYIIRYDFTENPVAAFLQKGIAKAEKIVHVDEPQFLEIQRQVLVQFGAEAVRFHTEQFFFFYE